jgi:hypothetical protein
MIVEHKKSNQFHYQRSEAEKLLWKEMKDIGWRCRRGYYFEPGKKSKDYNGLNSVDAFRIYGDHEHH